MTQSPHRYRPPSIRRSVVDPSRRSRRAPARRAARAGGGVTGVLAVLLALLMLPVALLFVVVWVSGWHLGFVRTGSMEPMLPTGSLVVLSPITADEVAAGMVIEFADPENPDIVITHRVVRVQRDDAGNLSFVTKGDANRERDTNEVPPENVRAKVRWHVGGVGRILWELRWPRSLVFVLVPLMLIAVGAIFRLAARGDPEDPAEGADADELAACTACRVTIGSADRYCRQCGVRQHRTGSVVGGAMPLGIVEAAPGRSGSLVDV